MFTQFIILIFFLFQYDFIQEPCNFFLQVLYNIGNFGFIKTSRRFIMLIGKKCMYFLIGSDVCGRRNCNYNTRILVIDANVCISKHLNKGAVCKMNFMFRPSYISLFYRFLFFLLFWLENGKSVAFCN